MRRIFAGIAVLLAAAGCGNLLDPAAAVVHGEKIPMDTIQSALDEYVATSAFEQLAQQGDADALKRKFEQGYLAQEIRRAVLTPEAEERGIEVTAQEVADQIDAIRADFPNESAFEEAIKEQGLTFEQLEILVKDRLLEEEIRAEVVADAGTGADDLEEYYREHEEDFSQTRSQHILVAGRGRATRIAAKLQSASEDRVERLFEKLAGKHSTDTSNAEDGGDLGYQPAGQFVEPFEDAMNELEEGAISDPARTEFGWHVIRVIDRRVAPFEEVRSQIESTLGTERQDETWQEYIVGLYEAADVEVNPVYGEFDEATQLVIDSDSEDIPGGGKADPSPGSSPLPPE